MLCRLGSLPFQAEFRRQRPPPPPRSNSSHSARRVLELSCHAGSLPTAQTSRRALSCAWPSTQSPSPKVPRLPLPRLGSLPACRYCPPCYATAPTPPTQTQPPQPPPTPPATGTATQQPQIVAAKRRHVYAQCVRRTDTRRTRRTGRAAADAPPAEKNRNTAKAEAKLEKALEYLATPRHHTTQADKSVVNASILASYDRLLSARHQYLRGRPP